MQYIDNAKYGKTNILSPEQAVMSGQIRTDNLDDLRRFERCFPIQPEVVLALAEKINERFTDVESITPGEKVKIIFNDLLPGCFSPAVASGWRATLQFTIGDRDTYTVDVADGKVNIQEGRHGTSTCSSTMEPDTLFSVLRFEALNDAHQFDDVDVLDDGEELNMELDDSQLELIAGGKGSCGAEGCGADGCGAAATGAGVCGGAACGAAATGAGACYSAVGGATACGADGCAAAGCGAAACGAAACGANVCAIEACAADACGADACAIDVIPVIPFI